MLIGVSRSTAMTDNTQGNTMSQTETTATPAAEAKPAAPKAPSLKSRATAIFQAKLVERSQGLFASNKEFRAAVLQAVMAELSVTAASAATMFNSDKKAAEAADPAVGLGRDPKKVKAPSSGKRGRPVGSKNKTKEATPAPAEASPVAADPAPAEAAA